MFLNSGRSQKNITKANRTSLLEIIGDQDDLSIVTPKRTAVGDTIMHFIRGSLQWQFFKPRSLHHVATAGFPTQESKEDNNPISPLWIDWKGVLMPLETARLKWRWPFDGGEIGLS